MLRSAIHPVSAPHVGIAPARSIIALCVGMHRMLPRMKGNNLLHSPRRGVTHASAINTIQADRRSVVWAQVMQCGDNRIMPEVHIGDMRHLKADEKNHMVALFCKLFVFLPQYYFHHKAD